VTQFLTDGPVHAPVHIVLAHGAGAAMTSPFLEKMAHLLTERGLQVSRFEFDYMAARRDGGKRRPPPRAEKLVPEYRRAIEELRAQGAGKQKLIVGGKSMGGRVASLAADELFSAGLIDGLVCLGYPFHPPGKPENLRTAHLEHLACPALIVQANATRSADAQRSTAIGYRRRSKSYGRATATTTSAHAAAAVSRAPPTLQQLPTPSPRLRLVSRFRSSPALAARTGSELRNHKGH
jgi:uncharacterized protein